MRCNDLAGLIGVAGLATAAAAESPKLKMTTPIPPGIAVPDSVDIQSASMHGTRRGPLEFGPANTTGRLFEILMGSEALFVTPET